MTTTQRHTPRTGFTLLELLVSIAIVMLLVVLVAVGLKGLRSAADRTRSLDALRQMVAGLAAYSNDHRMGIMPGYVDGVTHASLGLRVVLEDGTIIPPTWCEGGSLRCDGSSYVWRLAPYLNDEFLLLYSDANSKSVDAIVQEQYSLQQYGPSSAGSELPLGISERPTFGMNSIFVGGDSFHGGSWATDRNPWTPQYPDEVLAATRMSQVKAPHRIVVFAPSAMAGRGPTGDESYEDLDFGFCELRPPALELDSGLEAWVQPQWKLGQSGWIEHLVQLDTATGSGIPIDRAAAGAGVGPSLIPIGNLDGSTEQILIGELAGDMTRWDPKQVVKYKIQGGQGDMP